MHNKWKRWLLDSNHTQINANAVTVNQTWQTALNPPDSALFRCLLMLLLCAMKMWATFSMQSSANSKLHFITFHVAGNFANNGSAQSHFAYGMCVVLEKKYQCSKDLWSLLTDFLHFHSRMNSKSPTKSSPLVRLARVATNTFHLENVERQMCCTAYYSNIYSSSLLSLGASPVTAAFASILSCSLCCSLIKKCHDNTKRRERHKKK